MAANLLWKVTAINRETPDTNTYLLEEVNGTVVSYEAGQFLTLLIRHNEHEVRRSYSICSTPGIDKQVAITIKRKENGEISRYLLQTLQVGSTFNSLPPSGLFTIQTHAAEDRPVILAAAGSGIVPVFALLKKVLQYQPESPVLLIYQNRDEHNMIYRKELLSLQQQYADRLKMVLLFSNPPDHEQPAQRLNNWLFEKLLNDYKFGHFRSPEHIVYTPATANSILYTCGPGPFMRMVQFTARFAGFAETQLRKENFTIETVPPPAFVIDPAPREVILQFAGHHYQFTVSYPNTILQAALNNHIPLPYSCRGGRCGTCVARCTDGSVKMSINDVLTEKDMQQGLILTCVGFAESNVKLEA
ncbi:MAG: iron-sulfur cluster-binding domain-containing protein [Chitinophagaceae bacterium]